MNRFALYLGLATALVASCSTQEKDFQTPVQDDVVFYASFEQPVDEGTRVYANEDLLLRWTADDRISIFNKNTYNQQYRFAGETGDNAGGFDKVAGSEFATGNAISHIVSVYPYQSTTKISESESLTLTLPAEQHYAENSFGPGASTMVSVTADNFLQYKTVGGYLRLRLYGDGVSVSSITLKGNDGEKLAGKATVTMPLDGTPTVTLAEDATDQISLTCDTPVALGATAEESKDFWLVVPPVNFSKGFTVTVSGKGGVFEKSTGKTVTIERNKLSKMAPIKVELTPTQPRNVIYYTSTDGNVVTPRNDYNQFGANILSNEYVDGLGVITFDGDVTSIGGDAFNGCTSLTSITIPESVTSIGGLAFFGCTSLTSITIPESVTSIGSYAFFDCTSLTSISIPESVTSIGIGVFWGCTSLTSITIPDGVRFIPFGGFQRCSSLTSITIPDSVTSIDQSAFTGCTSLPSISIPESVTNISNYAFSGCASLTSITIPESVTSIGIGVFGGCSSLMSFSGKFSSADGLYLIDSRTLIGVAMGAINGECIIPESVTSIGSYAFNGCTSLTSISIPESVTSIGIVAFQNCVSLTSCTIPKGVTSIERFAFNGCTSLTSISIPESVTSIGNAAFQNCVSLTSCTIPASVTSIGDAAFQNCVSLTSITIPASVTSIGNWAFVRCTSLTSITVESVVPPLGGNQMFNETNDAPIYVPAGSVDAYKSAQYWSDYADRIHAIPSSSYSVPVPEAVDLGLSVKWASFNLGASKPEEYGDYFAWGETEPYYNCLDPLTWKEGKEAGYEWLSYKWCMMGSSYAFTKYCPSSLCGYNGFWDTKTVLDPEDDAASVNLGGNWRMPTDAEFRELWRKCSWEWTQVNGISGRKGTGPNGNSIFLPAAGSWGYTSLDEASSIGHYWSSSLNTDGPYDAFGLYISSDRVYWYYSSRSLGYTVRPVSE